MLGAEASIFRDSIIKPRDRMRLERWFFSLRTSNSRKRDHCIRKRKENKTTMWSDLCGITNRNSDSGSAFVFLSWPWVEVCIRIQYHRRGSDELFAGVRKDFKWRILLKLASRGAGVCWVNRVELRAFQIWKFKSAHYKVVNIFLGVRFFFWQIIFLGVA